MLAFRKLMIIKAVSALDGGGKGVVFSELFCIQPVKKCFLTVRHTSRAERALTESPQVGQFAADVCSVLSILLCGCCSSAVCGAAAEASCYMGQYTEAATAAPQGTLCHHLGDILEQPFHSTVGMNTIALDFYHSMTG